MNIIFYISAALAFASTIMAITNRNAIHALLYLIISLLSVSVIFYIIGAPLAAALEVIIYAGAIMVLFIFVVMMLNIGMEEETEKKWLTPKMWIVPSILAVLLLAIWLYVFRALEPERISGEPIAPNAVGVSLFTKYLIAVEIAGVLLLAGIVGAYHLGKQKKKVMHRFLASSQPGTETMTNNENNKSLT
jgi:NADH-quinone oxidoreductase subunit J